MNNGSPQYSGRGVFFSSRTHLGIPLENMDYPRRGWSEGKAPEEAATKLQTKQIWVWGSDSGWETTTWGLGLQNGRTAG